MQEGKTEFSVPLDFQEKISADLDVFYNPAMVLNRDLSILFLQTVEPLSLALPFAGSGVRGLRILHETQHKRVHFNDISSKALDNIRSNLQCPEEDYEADVSLFQKDANRFLLDSKGYDYIDLDPFGSPIHYLPAALERLSRKGYLAVTATDTAPLSGTFPRTCLRKYWASPLHGPLMHEVGLRILIRRVQLIGASYDRALYPVYAFSKEHYFRIIFSCKKGKRHADGVFAEHGAVDFSGTLQPDRAGEIGPLYLGKLYDKEVLGRMLSAAKDYPEAASFIQRLVDEVDTLGYFDLHALAQELQITPPRTEEVVLLLQEKGYASSRTHFSPYGVKTEASGPVFLKILTKKYKSPPQSKST